MMRWQKRPQILPIAGDSIAKSRQSKVDVAPYSDDDVTDPEAVSDEMLDQEEDKADLKQAAERPLSRLRRCCCCRILFHRRASVRWGSRVVLALLVALLIYFLVTLADVLSVRKCLSPDGGCVTDVQVSFADTCSGDSTVGVGMSATINLPSRQRYEISGIKATVTYGGVEIARTMGDVVFWAGATAAAVAAGGATAVASSSGDGSSSGGEGGTSGTLVLDGDTSELAGAAALQVASVSGSGDVLGRALNQADVQVKVKIETRVKTGAFIVPVSVPYSYETAVSCGRATPDSAYTCQLGGYPIAAGSGGSGGGTGTASTVIGLASLEVEGSSNALALRPNVSLKMEDSPFLLDLPELSIDVWYSAKAEDPLTAGGESPDQNRDRIAAVRLPAASIGAGLNTVLLDVLLGSSEAAEASEQQLSDLAGLAERVWAGSPYYVYVRGASEPFPTWGSFPESSGSVSAAAVESSQSQCVTQRVLAAMPAVRVAPGDTSSTSTSLFSAGSIAINWPYQDERGAAAVAAAAELPYAGIGLMGLNDSQVAVVANASLERLPFLLTGSLPSLHAEIRREGGPLAVIDTSSVAFKDSKESAGSSYISVTANLVGSARALGEALGAGTASCGTVMSGPAGYGPNYGNYDFLTAVLERAEFDLCGSAATADGSEAAARRLAAAAAAAASGGGARPQRLLSSDSFPPTLGLELTERGGGDAVDLNASLAWRDGGDPFSGLVSLSWGSLSFEVARDGGALAAVAADAGTLGATEEYSSAAAALFTVESVVEAGRLRDAIGDALDGKAVPLSIRKGSIERWPGWVFVPELFGECEAAAQSLCPREAAALAGDGNGDPAAAAAALLECLSGADGGKIGSGCASLLGPGPLTIEFTDAAAAATDFLNGQSAGKAAAAPASGDSNSSSDSASILQAARVELLGLASSGGALDLSSVLGGGSGSSGGSSCQDGPRITVPLDSSATLDLPVGLDLKLPAVAAAVSDDASGRLLATITLPAERVVLQATGLPDASLALSPELVTQDANALACWARGVLDGSAASATIALAGVGAAANMTLGTVLSGFHLSVDPSQFISSGSGNSAACGADVSVGFASTSSELNASASVSNLGLASGNITLVLPELAANAAALPGGNSGSGSGVAGGKAALNGCYSGSDSCFLGVLNTPGGAIGGGDSSGDDDVLYLSATSANSSAALWGGFLTALLSGKEDVGLSLSGKTDKGRGVDVKVLLPSDFLGGNGSDSGSGGSGSGGGSSSGSGSGLSLGSLLQGVDLVLAETVGDKALQLPPAAASPAVKVGAVVTVEPASVLPCWLSVSGALPPLAFSLDAPATSEVAGGPFGSWLSIELAETSIDISRSNSSATTTYLAAVASNASALWDAASGSFGGRSVRLRGELPDNGSGTTFLAEVLAYTEYVYDVSGGAGIDGTGSPAATTGRRKLQRQRGLRSLAATEADGGSPGALSVATDSNGDLVVRGNLWVGIPASLKKFAPEAVFAVGEIAATAALPVAGAADKGSYEAVTLRVEAAAFALASGGRVSFAAQTTAGSQGDALAAAVAAVAGGGTIQLRLSGNLDITADASAIIPSSVKPGISLAVQPSGQSGGGSGGSSGVGSVASLGAQLLNGARLASVSVVGLATDGSGSLSVFGAPESSTSAAAVTATALARVSVAAAEFDLSLDVEMPEITATIAASTAETGENLAEMELLLPAGQYAADSESDLLAAPSLRISDPVAALPKLVKAVGSGSGGSGGGILATLGGSAGGDGTTVLSAVVSAVLDAGVTAHINGGSGSSSGSSGGNGSSSSGDNGSSGGSGMVGVASYLMSPSVAVTSDTTEMALRVDAGIAALVAADVEGDLLEWNLAEISVASFDAEVSRDGALLGRLALEEAAFVPARGGKLNAAFTADSDVTDNLKAAVDDWLGVAGSSNNATSTSSTTDDSFELSLRVLGPLNDASTTDGATLAPEATTGIDLAIAVGRQVGSLGGSFGGNSSSSLLDDALAWAAIVGGDQVGSDAVLPCPLRSYCPDPPPSPATPVTLAAGARLPVPEEWAAARLSLPQLAFELRCCSVTPLASIFVPAAVLGGGDAPAMNGGSSGSSTTNDEEGSLPLGVMLATVNVTDLAALSDAADLLQEAPVEFHIAIVGDDVLSRVLADAADLSTTVPIVSLTSAGFYWPTECEGTWSLVKANEDTAVFHVALPSLPLPAPVPLRELHFTVGYGSSDFVVLDGTSAADDGDLVLGGGLEQILQLQLPPEPAPGGHGCKYSDLQNNCHLAMLLHDFVSGGEDGPVDLSVLMAFDRASPNGLAGGGGRQNMTIDLKLLQDGPAGQNSSEVGRGDVSTVTPPDTFVCNDFTALLDSFQVDVGSSVLSSLDIWNGIDVGLKVAIRNIFAFEVSLDTIRLTLSIVDPDGASAILGSDEYAPDNNFVVATDWTADLGGVTLAPGELRELGLTLSIPTDGLGELASRMYDEASLHGRLCGSATDGFVTLKLRANSSGHAFPMELPFDVKQLSLLGTASCALVEQGDCEPEWEDDFAYDASGFEADWLTVGDASLSDSDLQIVNNDGDKTGAAWLRDQWVVWDDWELEMKFHFSNAAFLGSGDGMALVLQDEGLDSIGSGGEYEVGYAGISPRSLGVVLDTYQYNEAMVWQGGNTSGSPSTDALAYVGNDYLGGGGLNFDDGGTQTLRIRYDWASRVLFAYYEEDTTPIVAAAVDIPALFPGGTAWVGATASTGRFYYTQVDVLGMWGRRPVTSAKRSRIEEDGYDAGAVGDGTLTVHIDARNTCGLPRYAGGAAWNVTVSPVTSGDTGAVTAANVTDLGTGRYEVNFEAPDTAGTYELRGCVLPCEEGEAVALGRVMVLAADAA